MGKNDIENLKWKSLVLNYYKRKDIGQAIASNSKDKEVVGSYGGKGYAKRPDTIQFSGSTWTTNSLCLADVDRDGDLDVVFANNRNSGGNFAFVNDGGEIHIYVSNENYSVNFLKNRNKTEYDYYLGTLDI